MSLLKFFYEEAEIISGLFGDFTHRILTVRRFGLLYRFHLQGSSNPIGLVEPRRWDRDVVPKRR